MEKTKQFSDYEVPDNDNLNLHKQWIPVETVLIFK